MLELSRRASIGVPAAILLQRGTGLGGHDGARNGGGEVAADDVERGAAILAGARGGGGGLRGLVFGQADDVEGARPVRQAADEAALLQPGDQAVDAGLRLEAQGLLHLIEGGRNAGFAQAFLDEFQQFPLLARQHGHPRLALSVPADLSAHQEWRWNKSQTHRMFYFSS
jgi:hypothetical protein